MATRRNPNFDPEEFLRKYREEQERVTEEWERKNNSILRATIQKNISASSSDSSVSSKIKEAQSDKVGKDEATVSLKPDTPSVSKNRPKEATQSETSISTDVTEPIKLAEVTDTIEMKDNGEIGTVLLADDVKDVKEKSEPKPEQKVSATSTPSVRQSRISAKMRLASRQEFHDAYLVKVVTKDGYPVTIARELMKRLYWICQSSGDHRACPTYLINNLLLELIDAMEAAAKEWADLKP